MTDSEMVVYLHDLARKTDDNILRNIADRLDYIKQDLSCITIDRSDEAREVFRQYFSK